MDTQILSDLGFTNAEIKIYLTLLELGESAAGSIIEKSKLQSSVVHSTLNKLIEKGFISFIQKGQRKYYQASNPKNISEYIDEKKKQYEKLLPELLKKQERKKEKPKIRAFKGKKGIKELFYELLNTESKELFSQGAPIESTQIMGKTFWKNYGQKLKAKKLKIKIIYNESFREKLEDMKGLNAESRFTKKGFEPLTETFIVGDKVGIIIWTEEPLGILIQNKTAAESYKVFWEQNWNLAKE
jgi:sugar-specific transcriptional regulator TrmB